MDRSSKVVSERRSISSMMGRRFAKDSRIADVSRPSADSVEPLMALTMPTRWSALTAFGDEYVIRPRPSSTNTPSPTRGACSTGSSSSAKGNSPSFTMTEKRSNRAR